MFLSTRWGKPTYEIESLPLSELQKQKVFWEHCSWGGVDDILATHHAFYVAAKTGKRSLTTTDVKRIAVYTSAVKAFVVESAKSIRAGFMGIFKAVKGAK